MMDKIRKRIYLTFINDFLLHLIGDGLITLQELKEVLEACVKENGLSFTDDQLNQLTQGLYEDAIYNSNPISDDPTNIAEEGIRFDQLKAQMEKHPGLLENLSIRFYFKFD